MQNLISSQTQVGPKRFLIRTVLQPSQIQEWQQQFQLPPCKAAWSLALELVEALQGMAPWMTMATPDGTMGLQ